MCERSVRSLGEIALDFEWSAVQASDWPATYFLGHRGLDLRNYAPALLWPGVNDDPGAALPSLLRGVRGPARGGFDGNSCSAGRGPPPGWGPASLSD